jgi:hypothetical protein
MKICIQYTNFYFYSFLALYVENKYFFWNINISNFFSLCLEVHTAHPGDGLGISSSRLAENRREYQHNIEHFLEVHARLVVYFFLNLIKETIL